MNNIPVNLLLKVSVYKEYLKGHPFIDIANKFNISVRTARDYCEEMRSDPNFVLPNADIHMNELLQANKDLEAELWGLLEAVPENKVGTKALLIDRILRTRELTLKALGDSGRIVKRLEQATKTDNVFTVSIIEKKEAESLISFMVDAASRSRIEQPKAFVHEKRHDVARLAAELNEGKEAIDVHFEPPTEEDAPIYVKTDVVNVASKKELLGAIEDT